MTHLLGDMDILKDILNVPSAHPALPGHFPGNPLVPGVVLLSMITETAERGYAGLVRIKGMPIVKFLAPVHPHTAVMLTVTPVSEGLLKFECRTGNTLIANGSIETTVFRS